MFFVIKPCFIKNSRPLVVAFFVGFFFFLQFLS